MVLALCALAGCQQQQPAPPSVRPTPGPGASLTRLDAAAKSALLAYASHLEFATAVTAIDEQFLIVMKNHHPAIGPWASISPEIGSAAIKPESLAAGRIIARVTLRGGSDSVTVYWYVDSSAGRWRSVWVPNDARWGLISGAVELHHHADTTLGAMPPRSRIVADAYQVDSTAFCTICDATLGNVPPPQWCRDWSASMELQAIIDALTPGLLVRPGGRPGPGGARRGASH
ncbi:MAG TPA: hypothetical protein VMG58_02430 [Candidatus Sulfotelmatobacter sp.]|nr:hypothetical protein [Candidatus Sulfotelmatobacter sp.]